MGETNFFTRSKAGKPVLRSICWGLLDRPLFERVKEFKFCSKHLANRRESEAL